MFPAKASMSGEEGLDDIRSLQGFERWRSRVQQKTLQKVLKCYLFLFII